MGTGQGGAYNATTNPGGTTFTQAQMDTTATSWGAGLATLEQELLHMKMGILTQNIFQLAQYNTPLAGVFPKVWGIVVDMGGQSNLKRPQFLAAQLANSAITYGGNMLTVTPTGTLPTVSVAGVNTVTMANAQLLQGFAFSGASAGHGSFIVLNTDPGASYPITLSGAAAPSACSTVTQTLLTSTNLYDTNEVSAIVAPVTSTLSCFQPSTGLTVPPSSATLLVW